MDPIDRSEWTFVGRTTNTDFYEEPGGALIVIPLPGTRDTGPTARENMEYQHEYWRNAGRRGGVVVVLDPVVVQDRDARTVYRTVTDPSLVASTALVGGTPLGRAIGSVFLGLSRLPIPTRVFARLEEALRWTHEVAGRTEASS